MTGMAVSLPGLTPAHFLCMQQKTDSVMALIRHYAIFNSTAFTMCASYPRNESVETDCLSALHTVCSVHCPSVELLQLLIQLDPSQATKIASRFGFTPLALLCHNAIRFRQEGTKYSDAVQCLLTVGSSAEYIGQALCGLINGASRSEAWSIEDKVASMQQHVIRIMDMLLAINPDAAKYRSVGRNLLHHIANLPSTMPLQFRVIIMQRIAALNADAVRGSSDEGHLPVHLAALLSPMEVMQFLLDLYPEKATSAAHGSPNILIYLLRAKHPTLLVSDVESKVRFLCSRFSQLLLQKDEGGRTALTLEQGLENRLTVIKILCKAGGRELVSAAYTPPLPIAEEDEQGDDDNEENPFNGWLPLHMFVARCAVQLRNCLPFSDEAEYLRMLLHLYPEAVGIEAGVGVGKTNPYQLAVYHNVNPYYLRMMLRAVPDLNPEDLCRLNFAERRMAMFLAFTAVSTDNRLILPRLRFAKMDLLKRVVSFL